METSDFIIAMEKYSKNQAYKNMGEPSYPYAFGTFVAHLDYTLKALNLTDDQKEILSDCLAKLIKIS